MLSLSSHQADKTSKQLLNRDVMIFVTLNFIKKVNSIWKKQQNDYCLRKLSNCYLAIYSYILAGIKNDKIFWLLN
jgi:hypothetical protein